MKVARRRVVSVGRRSLALIIPKSWATGLGIRAGDEALLRMRDDGLLVVEFGSRGCGEPGAGGVLKIGEGLSRGFAAKELLAAYALGLKVLGPPEASAPRAVFERAPGEGPRADLLPPRAPASPDKILGALLTLLEDAVDEFSGFLEELDAGRPGRIHRLEEAMDLMCYTLFKSIPGGLAALFRRGLSAGAALGLIAGSMTARAAEDLVDSLDRLVWRIQETGAASEDLQRIFQRIRTVLDDVMICLSTACRDAEIDKIYGEVVRTRAAIKDSMLRSPQPVQPMLAELEIVVNSVETMLEAALLKALARLRKEGPRGNA